MNSFMDELEMAVHGLSHAREKLNLKHLGTMTAVEQEMERLCELALKSARSQQSQNVQGSSSKKDRGDLPRQKSGLVVPPLPIHKISN